MQESILRVVAALRAAGVRVATPEVAEALEAVRACGLNDRATLRSALGATLAKRTNDLQALDRLFPLHFDPSAHASGSPRAEAVRHRD